MTWRRIAFLLVLAPAAAVASATALASLARATAWAGWSSWLLPVSLDVLAAFAVFEWASKSTPDVARAYARVLAVAALGVSVLGNAVSHLVSAGIVRPGWLLVVLVGAIPPAALGTAVHLAVLASAPVQSRRSGRRTVPAAAAENSVPVDKGARPSTKSSATAVRSPRPELSPRPAPVQLRPVPSGDDEELVTRVRQLDEQHRVEHGRPISRDKLRAALGCNNERAGRLLKAARAA
ncbi:hypothetical protein [Actinopolymorpha alba]|uniref:hypothetical protein n=1 Tax=Actinopolymorpha alba TaxID=533267 RepID=UPI000381EBB8|nr:hypothetical protein [Actinopolymorpha alba]